MYYRVLKHTFDGISCMDYIYALVLNITDLNINIKLRIKDDRCLDRDRP